MTMKWLALEVDCAECAGGFEQLIINRRVYDSLEEAKAGEEPFGRSYDGEWHEREEGGGVYSHSSSGGIEIIPLP